jgi:phenylacetate-coenzyme A ligase PaaK-like adenylate-forming protein
VIGLVAASRFDHAPPAERRSRVRARLEALARRCLDASRFYRERAGPELAALLEPGLDDATFFARYRALPVLGKDELVRSFDAISTDPEITAAAVAAFDRAHPGGDGHLVTARGAHTVKKTSGTSGALVYVVDTLAAQRRVAAVLFLRALWRVLWRRRLLGRLRRRPRVLVFVHRGNRSVYQGATGRSLPLLARLLVEVDLVGHEEPLAAVIARAARARPELVYGLPSRVAWLARAQERGELSLAPLAVYVGGETLDAELAALFRRAWPAAALVNTYGTTETKAIAIACPECGELHLLEDVVHLELLGDDGGEAPPGRPAARVLATSLLNLTVPVLRYELGDVVTPLEDAGCRVRTRRVRVAGREPAFLWLRDPRDGRWLPLDGRVLREKLTAVGARGFRVRQVDPARIEIAFVVDGAADLAAEGARCVRETLVEHGWGHVAPEVVVEVFDPDGWNRAGGKLGAITSAVTPAG